MGERVKSWNAFAVVDFASGALLHIYGRKADADALAERNPFSTRIVRVTITVDEKKKARKVKNGR